MIGARVTLRKTTLSSVSIKLRRRSGGNVAQRFGWGRLNSCIARSKPSGQRAQCFHADSRRFGEFRQIISVLLYGPSKIVYIGAST